MGLNLYSEIEEIFLDKKAANKLWDKFSDILDSLDIKKVLDLGCGSGEFCLKVKDRFNIKGIDLSIEQVKRAKNRGCECSVSDVCEINERFDAVVSIFDVVNYLDDEELERFFRCVKKITDYFVFDINSEYAMSELAVGTLKAEDEKRFGVLESDFYDNKLITKMDLFTKEGDCYKRKSGEIVQYYHSIDKILKITDMKLVSIDEITLYDSDEVEKFIITLRN